MPKYLGLRAATVVIVFLASVWYLYPPQRTVNLGLDLQGGAHFLLVDGSVRFLSENLDHITYQRLGGRRDGAPVGEF